MLGEILTNQAKPMTATITRTGLLLFSHKTTQRLNLSNEKYCVLADDTEAKNVLYLCIRNNDAQEAFRFNKSGATYFINTKKVFADIYQDYTKRHYCFSVERCEIYDRDLGGECYKLVLQ